MSGTTLHYAGLELPELGEGELAMGAVVLLKVLDAGGMTRYREFRSSTLELPEAMGMSSTFADYCRQQLLRSRLR